MDRRRILLLIFAALVVVAVGDIYINKINVFENFAQGFSFEVEETEPQRTVERIVTRDATGIERFLLEQQGGVIVVAGDDSDQITITSVVEIFAADDEAADAFANSLQIEMDTKDGTLVPKLAEGQRRGIRRVNTHWHVQVPQQLAVEIENRFGTILVGGVASPVELRGSGVMEVENVVGPVTVHNSLGTVKVAGVLGDTFVKSTIGSVELANINGDVELVSATVDSSIRDVNGQVTVESTIGSVQIDRVDGDVFVQSGAGFVAARDVSSRVDIHAETGNVVVRPIVPAPIDVTIAQGALNLNIPSELAAEYQFDLKAEEVIGRERVESFDNTQGGSTGAQLVKATVRRGEIHVSLIN